ncbi:MAG TPA: hypothetical protein VF316_10545 [Polyangiaceae bacterium]
MDSRKLAWLVSVGAAAALLGCGSSGPNFGDVFFSDPTYPTTNLVITRVKAGGTFKDVKLACGGTLSGWKPLGGTGQYESTNFDLIRGGTKSGSCDNGPQVATSDAPFGVMVWGLAEYASYAYPAGGNVAPINTVVVPPTPN